MMWSREIRLKLNMWHFQFSVWLKCSLREVHFAVKTPPESKQWFQIYSIEGSLKTIENKRNTFLFLAVSHNQFSQHPIDYGRLQHIQVQGYMRTCKSNVRYCFKTHITHSLFWQIKCQVPAGSHPGWTSDQKTKTREASKSYQRCASLVTCSIKKKKKGQDWERVYRNQVLTAKLNSCTKQAWLISQI